MKTGDARLARALLVLLAVTGPGLGVAHVQVQAQDCPLPAGFDHSVTMTQGDLEFTLACERSIYNVGDAVNPVLIVRNVGTATQVIPNPGMITPIQSFAILPGGCSAYDQAGCWPGRLVYSPHGLFFFGVPITLAPGACVQHAFTWNGVPESAAATSPGACSILAGYWEYTDGVPPEATMRLYLPDNGIRLPITIQDPGVPAVAVTWGAIKARAD